MSIETAARLISALCKSKAFNLRLAERIYAAHCVLANLAEKRTRPAVLTETDYCPLG